MMIAKKLMSTSMKTALLAGVAASALTFVGPDVAYAQGKDGGGNSESSGGGGGDGNNAGGDQASGQQGDRSQGGSGSGGNNAGGSNSNDVDTSDDDGDGPPDGAGQSGNAPTGDSGRPEDKGGQPDGAGGGEDDSDRPEWAGTPGGSAGRGDPPDAGGGGELYGDLYIILRDDQGVPILSPEGFVQPIDVDGNLIPLDEDGHATDESLVQEVEFGRLSVSRAPDDVLEGRSEEVIYVLNNATDVALDPSGRLLVTVDGVTRTIDAPLENLSIYIALMTDGYIEGVENDALDDLDFLVDGEKTVDDMIAAESFLAAASDKTGELTSDEVAYLNLILGIETTQIEGSNVTYSGVDYSAFSYDREDSYDGVVTTILVEQDDGSWVPTEVDVYNFVFGDVTNDTANGTLDAFSQAADDSRMVINYLHEYEVPVPPSAL